MSDDGSDDNDCHSASAPCRNLQTFLDRAADGADIYVTSNTLSLDFNTKHMDGWIDCVINSRISYTLRSYHNETIYMTCSAGMYVYLVIILDRATDGADIYVTSHTLSLDYIKKYIKKAWLCIIKSSLSYTLRSLSNSTINLTCSGMYVYL